MSKITTDDLLDHPVVDWVQDAGASLIAKQPTTERRKNSLTGAAQTALQLASLFATQLAGAPLWVTAVLALVIGVAEVIVQASMKGSVTPSVVEKITDEVAATVPTEGPHTVPGQASRPHFV